MNRLPAALALTLLAPALALASSSPPPAGGEGAAPESAGVLPTLTQAIMPMIVTFVVFGIVFAILAVKVWPTITKALHEREAKIRSEIEAAEHARQQAKAALAQYERALSDARAEAQKELERAKGLQAQQLAEMKARNDAVIAAEKDKALREIEAAKRLAIQDVYTQGAQLSTMVAGRILKRELNAGDYQRLVDEAVGSLQSTNN